MSRVDMLEVHLGMGSVRSWSPLALAMMLACAQQHEGNRADGDADESDESDLATNANATNVSAQDAAPQPTPTAGGSGQPMREPFPPPPPSPGPALFPLSGASPFPQPAGPQSCARQVFESLAPPDHVRVIQPCTYWVPGFTQVIIPKYVRVMVDGKNVPLGVADDGWIVAEDNKGITLLGAACEAAKVGASIAITNECILPILN